MTTIPEQTDAVRLDVDPRAIADPNGVECPVVDKRSERQWSSSKDAELRERCFRIYYNGPFGTVRDPKLRFAYALIASCRPCRKPELIPQLRGRLHHVAMSPAPVVYAIAADLPSSAVRALEAADAEEETDDD